MNRPQLIPLIHIADLRGEFYELWKGNPDFIVRQANVSRSKRGVIRGIHAEPWDKYIHVLDGEAFVVLVHMETREVVTFEVTSQHAVFVPEGWGNSFQALTDVTYMYLVGGLWNGQKYPQLKYNDPELNIPWKDIPVIVSEKDA